MTSRSRVRKSAVAATAVAASAALLAGATLGPTAIQSAQSERTLVADPTLAASTGVAGGIAIDPEGIIRAIPGVGDAAWGIVKNELGETTAIAILPGVAAALASKGESATAFSLLGLAVATTDVVIDLPLVPDINLDTGQLACLGALAFAHSSTEGACLNILGTFDAGYNSDRGEASVALTNPFKLLTDGIDANEIIQAIITKKPLSQVLTADFARLTLGGPEFAKLTSSYGFQPIAAGGGVMIGWLGGTMVLFPTVADGPLKGSVNYLGLPKFDFDGFPDITNIGSIIPSLSFGKFKTPIPGVEIPAWSTGDILGSTSASTTQLVTVSETGSTPEAKTLSAGGSEATSTAPEPAPIESAPVVPETQPEPEVEPTVTPDPVDPPAAVESTPEVESIPEVETPSETESAGEASSLDGVDDAA